MAANLLSAVIVVHDTTLPNDPSSLARTRMPRSIALAIRHAAARASPSGNRSLANHGIAIDSQIKLRQAPEEIFWVIIFFSHRGNPT